MNFVLTSRLLRRECFHTKLITTMLPVVASAPEPVTEKAVAIGTCAVAAGLPTHLGQAPPVLGSKTVTEVLTATVKDLFSDTSGLELVHDQAIGLDPDHKRVQLASGAASGYDRLLIATGSSAVLPAIAGLREARQVFALRDLGRLICWQKARRRTLLLPGEVFERANLTCASRDFP